MTRQSGKKKTSRQQYSPEFRKEAFKYREYGLRLSTTESMAWDNVKFRSEKEELRRVQTFSESHSLDQPS